MATELSEFPAETRGRTKGVSRYNFEAWFNGKPWQLDSGVDFQCKMVSFRSTVFQAAKERKVKIRTATINEGKSLVVQKVSDLDGAEG